MTDLIRTKRDGCWQVRSNTWGAFLMPVEDPLAEATLEKGALEHFELNADIARIPAALWSRWVQLCFHFAHLKQGDLEVSCRLLRHEDDKSRWRILIPRQEVSGASVRIDSFDEAIDIESGELIASYPPAGWIPAGSSHSHNSMALNRFSSTDDASELGCPGLHVVLSHIDTAKRTYVCTASVTANHRRFYLPDAAAVIDLTARDDTFHPAVLAVVQPERPRGWLPLQPHRNGATAPMPDDIWPTEQWRQQPKRSTAPKPAAKPADGCNDWLETAERITELLTNAAVHLTSTDFQHLLWEIGDISAELREQLNDFDSNWDLDDDDSDPTQDRTNRAAAATAIRLPDGEW